MLNKTLTLAIAFLWLASPAVAGLEKSLKRVGWITHETDIPFKELYPRLKSAIKKTELRQITTASASAGAKGRGLTIPGNRIVGVYNNNFAVRMLEASVAAGIEAPLRFYLTERTDGGSNLSYKLPSYAFSPYFEEGGKALKDMSSELDDLFAIIA
ncbi:MAG: DUF302 domain-containing protein, partial [Pseudomonadota bacterium]